MDSAAARTFTVSDLCEYILLKAGGPEIVGPAHDERRQALRTILPLRVVNKCFRDAIDCSYKLQRRRGSISLLRVLVTLKWHYPPVAKYFAWIDIAKYRQDEDGTTASIEATVLESESESEVSDYAEEGFATPWKRLSLRCLGYHKARQFIITVKSDAEQEAGAVIRGQQMLHLTEDTTLGQLCELYHSAADKVLPKQQSVKETGTTQQEDFKVLIDKLSL